MKKQPGFVIAFYFDQDKYPYLGLTCKDRALRTIKSYIPGEIASALATLKGKEDFDGLLRRISLEAGIVKHDREVLDFIRRKVSDGEPIFLDLTEGHIADYNRGPFAESHFVIAAIEATPNTFALMNPWLFSTEEQEAIISIVRKSQAERPRERQSSDADALEHNPVKTEKESAVR